MQLCMDSFDELYWHLSHGLPRAAAFMRRFARIISFSTAAAAAHRRRQVFAHGLLSGVEHEGRVHEVRHEMRQSGERTGPAPYNHFRDSMGTQQTRRRHRAYHTTTGRALETVVHAAEESREYDLAVIFDLTACFSADAFVGRHTWCGPGPYMKHRGGQTAQVRMISVRECC